MTGMFGVFGRGLFHPTLNIARYRTTIPKETRDKIVLNIGSGGYRMATHIINMDLSKIGEVDVLGNAHFLPFRGECADVVLLLAVLEHVEEPKVVISESYRVLRKGGFVYCEFPFLQPEHNAPQDYWRVTIQGLSYLFKDFEEIDVGICNGPGSTLARISVELPRVILNIKYLSEILSLSTRILVSPLKYGDRLIAKLKLAKNIASGFYYYGRKK